WCVCVCRHASEQVRRTWQMSRTRVFIVLAIGFLSLLPTLNASGADVNAASCAQADVQAAINTAGDGARVLIPAGNCSWSTNVGWQDKNIYVKGAGVDQTVISRDGEYIFYVS